MNIKNSIFKYTEDLEQRSSTLEAEAIKLRTKLSTINEFQCE